MTFGVLAMAIASMCGAADGETKAFSMRAPSAVEHARIEKVNGVPRLLINDAPVAPVIFFYNTDVGGEGLAPIKARQIGHARDTGVHVYSLPLRCPRKDGGAEPNYAYVESLLEPFVRNDPGAIFIVRLFPGPWPFWKEWADIPQTEIEQFADGSQGGVSMASDYFWGFANRDTAALIQHLENSAYGPRILAYHPGAPDSELFHHLYREKGPDYSGANHRRFRAWLRAKYGDDAALRAAWGDPNVTLDTAAVPEAEPGRFPIHGPRGGETVQLLYRLPEQQDWVDFSAYSNDIVADRIIDWARLIKAETGGRKLSMFFYGYTMELPGSFSGHFQLQRVLACPDVDMLVSPYSYADRDAGRPGSFMTPVDSIALHGKLWVNEDDTRTSWVDKEHATRWWWGFGKHAETDAESLSLLDRNFASILAHRAGTWWMDLSGAGAFDHPGAWELFSRRLPLYEALYDDPAPYRPDVAMVVDEQARNYVRDDWYSTSHMMHRVREALGRCGATAGFYTLQDYLAGRVPPTRLVVFPNALALTDAEIAAIRERLERDDATAVWHYAPAVVGDGAPDPDRIAAVVGMPVRQADGSMGSVGADLLDGLSWGADHPVSPRFVIQDDAPGARIIGRFPDGAAAAAISGRHVFLADLSASADVYRRIAQEAGAHIWVDTDHPFQCDGRFLAVHAGEASETTLRAPDGHALAPIDAPADVPAAETVAVAFEGPETRWFRVVPASPAID